MIPLKIQLKNFLSYGPELQTIDFTPYNLICLCGKNGHGKSALLDAITWALWGTARKVLGDVRPDIGLLRLGQTYMQVILDFSFNGQLYRVRREFAKTHGKPHAVLEFGIVNPDTNEMNPLTDKTIRATQAKIISTLNLTAESFINSAFIRQGHANEFSQKAPKDRKKILANILGLNMYDQLRTLAQERMKGFQLQKQALNATVTLLAQELSTKAAVVERSQVLQQELETIATQEQELKKHKQELATQQNALIAHEQQRHTYQAHYDLMLQEQSAKQQQLQELVAAWRSTHRQLSMLDHTTLKQEQLLLQTLIAKEQTQLTQRIATQEKLLTTRQQAQQREHFLHKEHETNIFQQECTMQKIRIEQEQTQKRFEELTATLCNQDLLQQTYAQEEESLAQQLAQQTTLNTQLTSLEQQFIKRKNYYHTFIAQGNWVTQELDDLRKKQLLVHDETNPSCPLCEQNLSAARKRFLKKSFQEREQFLLYRCNRLKQLVSKLKQLLVEQHAIKEQFMLKQQEYAKQTVRHATIGKERAQLLIHHAATIADHATLAQIIKEQQYQYLQQEQIVKELRSRTASVTERDTAYQQLKQSMATLEHELSSLVHDQTQYNKHLERLRSIEQLLATHANSSHYQALQEQRKHEIHTRCQQLKILKTKLITQHKKLLEHAAQAPCKQTLTQAIAKLDQDETQLRAIKETMIHEHGQVKHHLGKLTQLEQDHAVRQREIADLQERIQEYEIIAAAMGKDGLQALLIEESIPEIEQEANIILAKLTDNQTHIFIESLKDLKSGGTKETLDIHVSDSMGLRAYEMFSGGEAFRIDFALRVGIAKLLARRAGTSLQTLIIDEGFGSQDEEGLNLIMDAIHRIQDDFAKIIIVSHLNAMKNQFPVHFFVQKMAQGSMVNVIEQA